MRNKKSIFESYSALMHKAETNANIKNDFGNLNFDEIHSTLYDVQKAVYKVCKK